MKKINRKKKRSKKSKNKTKKSDRNYFKIGNINVEYFKYDEVKLKLEEIDDKILFLYRGKKFLLDPSCIDKDKLFVVLGNTLHIMSDGEFDEIIIGLKKMYGTDG